MGVVKVAGNKVVMRWQDVADLADLREKYGLQGPEYLEADHPPGTLFDGARFAAPPQIAPQPEPESPERRALREIAKTLPAAMQARIAAILDEDQAQ